MHERINVGSRPLYSARGPKVGVWLGVNKLLRAVRLGTSHTPTEYLFHVSILRIIRFYLNIVCLSEPVMRVMIALEYS